MASSALQVVNWHDLEGHIIDRKYNSGFIVLSFLISYIGSWTTLELMHRRTSSRGWFNWCLLCGASSSMGGIAIWSMHFIGNRAIVMGRGEPQIQLTYSAGFTALSLFVPIIVMLIAFAVVLMNDRIVYVRLGAGAAFAGAGVSGMHYIGQLAITNFDCKYNPGYIVASVIIAIIACLLALGLFSLFRSTWRSTWWKRALCAIILACGVSGMHWVASTGKRYRLRRGASGANTRSRNVTTIAISAISVLDCMILLALTLVAHRRKVQLANRAREIVLAVVIFDTDGQLLVTAEGVLPSRKITDLYYERDINDTFDIANSVFHWMFRTSRCWKGVKDLIEPMRDHLQWMGLRYHVNSEPNFEFVDEHGTPTKDSHLIFRELFCIAAADIAIKLELSLEELGVMFDKIMYTGQTSDLQRFYSSQFGHYETTQENRGSGQLLFLVQEADKQKAQRLMTSGYRFANPKKVVPIIASTFQVVPGLLALEIADMQEYATVDHILDPGVHLAIFAIKPSVNAGFNVLVRKTASNLLPTVSLSYNALEQWQLTFIRNMKDFSISMCLKYLKEACEEAGKTNPAANKEGLFALELLNALLQLQSGLCTTILDDACLIAKPVFAPCLVETQPPSLGKATLITFRIIVPINSRPIGGNHTYVPLSFFTMQQHAYRGSADHAILARKTFREFATVLYFSKMSHTISFARFKFWRRWSPSRDDEYNADVTYSHPVPNLELMKRALVKKKISTGLDSWQDMEAAGNKRSKKHCYGYYMPKRQYVGYIMKSLGLDVEIENNPGSEVSRDQQTAAAVGMLERHITSQDVGGITSNASKEVDPETFVGELISNCV